MLIICASLYFCQLVMDVVFNKNTIEDASKLKALAGSMINVLKILKYVLGRAENIVRKQERVSYNIFSPFNVIKKLLH